MKLENKPSYQVQNSNSILEIASFELNSAEIALQSCADRIEFCSAIELGGTTPNFEEFEYLKSMYDKPIYVMIRPRGGNFVYTPAEIDLMIKQIIKFRKANVDGFVFGALTAHRKIDKEVNRALLEVARGKPCTFHRAFDRTTNLIESLDLLIDLGFKTVLTSGGKENALEGAENIKNLINHANHRIEILIGGGVRSENILEIKEITKGTHFHSSAILKYEMFANPYEIIKLKEYSL